jgi:hypothetical protein
MHTAGAVKIIPQDGPAKPPLLAAGALLYVFGTPLALGSYWGFLGVALMLLAIVWRLLDEERLLVRMVDALHDSAQLSDERCKLALRIRRIRMTRLRMSLRCFYFLMAVAILASSAFAQTLSLLVLSKSAEAASPYAISVQPGDTEVPKGSDQTILARLAKLTPGPLG